MNDLVMVVLRQTREVVIGKGKITSSQVSIEEPISIVLRPVNTSGQTEFKLEPQNFPVPFSHLLLIEEHKSVTLYMEDLIQTYTQDEMKKDLIDWYLTVTSKLDLVSKMPKKTFLN